MGIFLLEKQIEPHIWACNNSHTHTHTSSSLSNIKYNYRTCLVTFQPRYSSLQFVQLSWLAIVAHGCQCASTRKPAFFLLLSAPISLVPKYQATNSFTSGFILWHFPCSMSQFFVCSLQHIYNIRRTFISSVPSIFHIFIQSIYYCCSNSLLHSNNFAKHL